MVHVDWSNNGTREGSVGQHVRPVAHFRGGRERAYIVLFFVCTEVHFTDWRSGYPYLAVNLSQAYTESLLSRARNLPYWWSNTFIGARVLAIDPAVLISCMFIGASVANSASYGTVRAPFDQCCGFTVTLKIFV